MTRTIQVTPRTRTKTFVRPDDSDIEVSINLSLKTRYAAQALTYILSRCQDIKSRLNSICSQDTAVDPELWTPENPSLGHCAIASRLIADQKLMGTVVLNTNIAVPSWRH